jgi:hypothetical protein
MYKIDDEFRPRGRVFMKAQHAEQQSGALIPAAATTTRKSSLKHRGPAITTNLDDRNITFQHDVAHEKTIEAVVTEYEPYPTARNGRSYDTVDNARNGNHALAVRPYGGSGNDNITSLQQITRNKHLSTEVLGSTLETTKTSQKAPDGHRRITTHIVRKITTLSRAEEQAQVNDMIKHTKNVRTTEIGYMSTDGVDSKRPKVTKNKNHVCVGIQGISMSLLSGIDCKMRLDTKKSFYFSKYLLINGRLATPVGCLGTVQFTFSRMSVLY